MNAEAHRPAHLPAGIGNLAVAGDVSEHDAVGRCCG